MRFRRANDSRRAAYNGRSLAFLYSVRVLGTANLIKKNSSLVGLIVRTVTVERTVGVKDFPVVRDS